MTARNFASNSHLPISHLPFFPFPSFSLPYRLSGLAGPIPPVSLHTMAWWASQRFACTCFSFFPSPPFEYLPSSRVHWRARARRRFAAAFRPYLPPSVSRLVSSWATPASRWCLAGGRMKFSRFKSSNGLRYGLNHYHRLISFVIIYHLQLYNNTVWYYKSTQKLKEKILK